MCERERERERERETELACFHVFVFPGGVTIWITSPPTRTLILINIELTPFLELGLGHIYYINNSLNLSRSRT